MDKKQKIINEYLTTTKSFPALEREYGIPRSTIHDWVSGYRQALESAKLHEMKKDTEVNKDIKEDLPTDIKELQKQLELERLHSKLLNTMIDIAEQQLKIPIRKKYGTRRLEK